MNRTEDNEIFKAYKIHSTNNESLMCKKEEYFEENEVII